MFIGQSPPHIYMQLGFKEVESRVNRPTLAWSLQRLAIVGTQGTHGGHCVQQTGSHLTPHTHPLILTVEFITPGSHQGDGTHCLPTQPALLPNPPYEASWFGFYVDREKNVVHTIFKQKCLFFSFIYTISWGFCTTGHLCTRPELQPLHWCSVGGMSVGGEGGFHCPQEPGTLNSTKDQGAHHKEISEYSIVSWKKIITQKIQF